jgi:hypothetical protein
MRDPISIVVTPRGRGRYEVRHGRLLLVRSASESLFAAPRALLAEGAAPDTVLTMRHAGFDHVALVAPVGVAGRFTVETARNGCPRFARRRVGRAAGISPAMCLGDDEAPEPEALRGGAGT